MGGFQIPNFKSQVSDCKCAIGSRVARIAVVLAALAGSSAAFAQSCPACYANAAAQTPGMLQALKTGILVMMFPSLGMFIVIFAVVYRRRECFNEDKTELNFKQTSVSNWKVDEASLPRPR